MDFNTKCRLNNFLNDLINNNGICYYAKLEIDLHSCMVPISRKAVEDFKRFPIKTKCTHFDNSNKDCCKRDCPLYKIFDLIPLVQFEGKEDG
jgi:hypothetical protein